MKSLRKCVDINQPIFIKLLFGYLTSKITFDIMKIFCIQAKEAYCEFKSNRRQKPKVRESNKNEKREVKRYLAAIKLLSLLITLKVSFQYSVLEHENGKNYFTVKLSKRRRKNAATRISHLKYYPLSPKTIYRQLIVDYHSVRIYHIIAKSFVS